MDIDLRLFSKRGFYYIIFKMHKYEYTYSTASHSDYLIIYDSVSESGIAGCPRLLVC